ncbi:ribosomal protein eS27-like isoform X1 [Erinaceus europaeus]|uniref:40S ribosomal protein S27 n=1 Tax=Erinaceus europaeus TaxID=9365 RepID=A0ABM3W198_ERIEU|nr:ribosomal protein eS27-like isoform X1 [Erinaceus europaeus]
MPLARDLLHPSLDEEKKKHKKKRLVQSPNSYFMDVKCPGCYKITTVFSHAQTVVLCVGCSTVLCQPTGGKARLTEETGLCVTVCPDSSAGCSFRRKQH